MVWRAGGLLVGIGLLLDLTLSGALVVIGFGCMFVGVITLALHLEASVLGEQLAARPTSARAADEAGGDAA